MTTTVTGGRTYKHFQAVDPVSKFMYANVYSNAKSSTAAAFLKEVIAAFPYPIKSIQVDGGSEFMADFEKACADLKIELIILPPRKPEYNGGVERGNRTFREEFYDRANFLEDSVRGIQSALTKAVQKYNTYRPHRNLNGFTPMQYIQNVQSETLRLSQTM